MTGNDLITNYMMRVGPCRSDSVGKRPSWGIVALEGKRPYCSIYLFAPNEEIAIKEADKIRVGIIDCVEWGSDEI